MCSTNGLPKQFNVDFRLPGRNLFRDLPRDRWKLTFLCRTVHDNDSIPVDTQVPAARVHDMQSIPFLLADIRHVQLFGIEELDDPAF